MSEKLKEALSAVVDGEADEFELRRVLDELPKDPALRSSWERYHLIGAAIRREPTVARTRMRERIWAEIAGDPIEAASPEIAPGAAERPEKRARLGRWTSLAVAASVALAVVIGVSNLVGTPDEPQPAIAGVAGTPDPAEQEAAINQLVLSSEVSSLDEQRTDAYRIYHAQTRGMNQPGFGAFAKMVSYQKD